MAPTECAHDSEDHIPNIQDSQPPEEFSFSRTALIELNPDREYIYMCDEAVVEFIRCYYGMEMLQHYLSINPAYGPARADLFRYLLIYEKGGAYFDIKSGANMPLSSIVADNDSYILARWSNPKIAIYQELITEWNTRGQEYQNWHIIGEAKHLILEQTIADVIGNIVRGTSVVGKMGVLRLTGPIAYTKAIYKAMWSSRYRVLGNEVDAGLLYSMRGPAYSQEHTRIMKDHYSRCKEPIIIGPVA